MYHLLVFLCISLLFILDAMSRGYMSYISSYRCTYHSVILLWYISSMSNRDQSQRVWPIGTKDQCLGYMYSEPDYHVTLLSWWWGWFPLNYSVEWNIAIGKLPTSGNFLDFWDVYASILVGNLSVTGTFLTQLVSHVDTFHCYVLFSLFPMFSYRLYRGIYPPLTAGILISL